MEKEEAVNILQFWLAADNFQSQLAAKKGQYDGQEAQNDAMILYDKWVLVIDVSSFPRILSTWKISHVLNFLAYSLPQGLFWGQVSFRALQSLWLVSNH